MNESGHIAQGDDSSRPKRDGHRPGPVSAKKWGVTSMRTTRAIVGAVLSVFAFVSFTACGSTTTDRALPPGASQLSALTDAKSAPAVDSLIDQTSGTVEDRRAFAEFLALLPPASRRNMTMIRGDRAISTRDVKFPPLMGRTKRDAHRMTLANGHVVDLPAPEPRPVRGRSAQSIIDQSNDHTGPYIREYINYHSSVVYRENFGLMVNTIRLPCENEMFLPEGDNGFVYTGGWSGSGRAALDYGFVHEQKTADHPAGFALFFAYRDSGGNGYVSSAYARGALGGGDWTCYPFNAAVGTSLAFSVYNQRYLVLVAQGVTTWGDRVDQNNLVIDTAPYGDSINWSNTETAFKMMASVGQNGLPDGVPYAVDGAYFGLLPGSSQGTINLGSPMYADCVSGAGYVGGWACGGPGLNEAPCSIPNHPCVTEAYFQSRGVGYTYDRYGNQLPPVTNLNSHWGTSPLIHYQVGFALTGNGRAPFSVDPPSDPTPPPDPPPPGGKPGPQPIEY